MTDPDSRAGLQLKVKRVMLALQDVGVHEHVAEELARNFVAVAIFWEPGDPSLYSTAVAAMAQRWEHPGAGLGREWRQHLPKPERWHVLAQAMVEAAQHDTPQRAAAWGGRL